MDFYTVIDRLKAKANPATEQPNPVASDNPIDTMPGNMPLTNRLGQDDTGSSEYGQSKTGTHGSHI